MQIGYHLLKLGHACVISIIANHGCKIASFMISLSSANFELSALLAKPHHASIASCIGSNGRFVFPSGVVLVFAPIGVVGDACPVVRA